MSKMNLKNGTVVYLTSTEERGIIQGRQETGFVVPRYIVKLDNTEEEIVVTAFEIRDYDDEAIKEAEESVEEGVHKLFG